MRRLRLARPGVVVAAIVAAAAILLSYLYADPWNTLAGIVVLGPSTLVGIAVLYARKRYGGFRSRASLDQVQRQLARLGRLDSALLSTRAERANRSDEFRYCLALDILVARLRDVTPKARRAAYFRFSSRLLLIHRELSFARYFSGLSGAAGLNEEGPQEADNVAIRDLLRALKYENSGALYRALSQIDRGTIRRSLLLQQVVKPVGAPQQGAGLGTHTDDADADEGILMRLGQIVDLIRDISVDGPVRNPSVRLADYQKLLRAQELLADSWTLPVLGSASPHVPVAVRYVRDRLLWYPEDWSRGPASGSPPTDLLVKLIEDVLAALRNRDHRRLMDLLQEDFQRVTA